MTYEVEFSQYVRQLSSLYCVDLDDNSPRGVSHLDVN